MATVQKSQPGAQRVPQPAAAKPATSGTLPAEKIAQRAYEIWQAKGRPEGQDKEDWFQAESELRAGIGPSRTSR
jgi:hypothetical protein